MSSQQEEEPKKIGGWLILVGIGVVLSPVRIILLTGPIFMDVFNGGIWGYIVESNPNLATFIAAEAILNVAMIIAWIYAAFIFFMKKWYFPRLFIGLMLFSFVFVVIDSITVSFIIPGEPMFDSETKKEAIRTFIVAAIWIPYMLMSKRVKATFVK